MSRTCLKKNQRKDGAIAHDRSTNPWCCPVQSAVRRVLCHREHSAVTGTPFDSSVVLASYHHEGHCLRVLAAYVTDSLRLAASVCFHVTGICPENISARSLRLAGGAMALLCAGDSPDRIKLVGRWHSEAMM